MSNFTLTISKYTIRDLERLKGKHVFNLFQDLCDDDGYQMGSKPANPYEMKPANPYEMKQANPYDNYPSRSNAPKFETPRGIHIVICYYYSSW